MLIVDFIHKLRMSIHRRRISRSIKGGVKLHLGGVITVIKPGNLQVGENVHIGEDGYFNCHGGISIGDHTVLSRRVTIYSYDHDFVSGTGLPYGEGAILKEVKIGRYVWIGMNVCIAPGTTIGDGAIIGLGTVVSGTVPENAILVGAKTRIVGFRDQAVTARLAESHQFFSSYSEKVAAPASLTR